MSKITEIDLGSTLLSGFILLGYVATALVVLRVTIIVINYLRVNIDNKKEEKFSQESNDREGKGF